MAEELLGPAFEIHGGGLDLVFPHHENELAQSRALGHEFAQIWMHNGMLRFTGEKMSKSVGNVVDDPARRSTAGGARRCSSSSSTAHWRKPIDFSDETMARPRLAPRAFRDVFRSPSRPAPDGAWERFAAALEDDFNTPDGARRAARVARPRAAAARRSTSSGWRRSPRRTRRRPRSSSSATRRQAARAARATSPRPTGCAARSRPPAGRCATWPAATGSCRRRVTREQVYGRRAGARGAARAAGGARAVGDRARRRRRAVAREKARACRSSRSAS